MEKNKTADIVVNNIKMLLQKTGWSVPELEKKSGVPKRTIYAYLKKERKPSVEITDEIAQGFGLNGWHLLLPNLEYDIAKNSHLDGLIDKYISAAEETKGYIDSILDREQNN